MSFVSDHTSYFRTFYFPFGVSRRLSELKHISTFKKIPVKLSDKYEHIPDSRNSEGEDIQTAQWQLE